MRRLAQPAVRVEVIGSEALGRGDSLRLELRPFLGSVADLSYAQMGSWTGSVYHAARRRDGGEIVGLLWTEISGARVEFVRVQVGAQHRRQGICGALLDSGIRDAVRRPGVESILIDTTSDVKRYMINALERLKDGGVIRDYTKEKKEDDGEVLFGIMRLD